ncbi:MerR family transcriptional regulator [Paenibacillus oryzisoli]|uniref:MerR family transcriptional regulator n=1 Tax=Paenibacillus oryzisoli TaxID=1850517 RepID=UPI003D2CBBD2
MENTFSSKQVAEETGLSIHTLRYYEQIGLIRGIQRDENGYRQYTQSDIGWLQIIHHLRTLGVPIREMQEFLEQPNSEDVSARREYLEKYRDSVQDRIKKLEQTLVKLDDKINFLKTLE